MALRSTLAAGLVFSVCLAAAAKTQPAIAQAEPATQRTTPTSRPSDAPTDSPLVTCRSWAIVDGATGALLWGGDAEVPRKAASTTKVMCAYVILALAEREPAILQERVTFSEAADKTSGSTAGINAGESITVAECLYGLMLPSGNDAGIALAEHFNARFAPPDVAPQTVRAYTNFVAEMNREAKRLGMNDTTYRLPFGDGGTADDRTTTAKDLGMLCSAAMKLDSFRHYVSTREHAVEASTADGSSRNVTWKNTNRFLGNGWCDGIKTGTTNQAGACLTTSARRGADHLIVVVLGAAKADDRYADTESLLDWAWTRRAD